MIDAPADALQLVRRILAQYVPECAVWAFGSRVSGGARPASDLDLAIFGQTSLELSRLNRLQEAFEFSELPFRVDAVDWHRLSPEFQRLIEAGFEVLQPGP